ncbi:hypothetical protein BSL78_27419 [Apostichopus japonicus]|uniref:DC-STAMP domain-containing protein 2 n=1 Tax=Stichopus japonicus TaxID=307972 RepID=A0A2G8JJ36_STIJA|nr:hypothetical protein BSL78_27419 [Apostichopus japonicus]
MSERASHRKIKAVVGFAFGIILGIVLYMILDFALEYHWKHALIITSIATLFMALSLALTVRARCVAALMLPTLCTSKGRGAIYAIIIGLLLSGPIQNIYSNSEETSNSMSCSAEMAVNTSREIQQASQEVLNNYVRALARSVDKLHEATQTVSEVFRPIDQGVDVLQQLLSEAGETLRYAVTTCDDVLGSAYDFCNESLQKAYIDCKRALGGKVSKRSITFRRVCGSFSTEATRNIRVYVVHSRQKRQGISGACEILNVAEACKLLKLDVVCGFPGELNNFIENNLVNILMQLQRLHDMFVVDINFDVYWENRQRLNGSVKAVQEAVRQELRQSHDIIKQIFSVSDKILALSLVWLAIRSYNYYWKFCTKDKFDNFYITSAFKKMERTSKIGSENNP